MGNRGAVIYSLTPKERPEEPINEEPLTTKATTGSHTCVLLGVKSIEEGTINQIGGPNHGRRGNKEPTSDATNREADKLR